MALLASGRPLLFHLLLLERWTTPSSPHNCPGGVVLGKTLWKSPGRPFLSNLQNLKKKKKSGAQVCKALTGGGRENDNHRPRVHPGPGAGPAPFLTFIPTRCAWCLLCLLHRREKQYAMRLSHLRKVHTQDRGSFRTQSDLRP